MWWLSYSEFWDWGLLYICKNIYIVFVKQIFDFMDGMYIFLCIFLCIIYLIYYTPL
jgi:hypothetical protein